jgi:predicted membrane protein
MENTIFIKIEIYIFIISLLYILYYLGSKIYTLYFNVKNVVNPKKIQNRKTSLNKVNLKKKNIKKEVITSNFKISHKSKEKL